MTQLVTPDTPTWCSNTLPKWYWDFYTKTTTKNNNIQIGELSTQHNSDKIVKIKILSPAKVVELTFGDGQKEKLVCNKDDVFDLRKCCYIGIAKHLYKSTLTFEGIEKIASDMTYVKHYVKIVNQALSKFKRELIEEAKQKRVEEERKEIIKRKRQKAKNKKKKKTFNCGKRLLYEGIYMH